MWATPNAFEYMRIAYRLSDCGSGESVSMTYRNIRENDDQKWMEKIIVSSGSFFANISIGVRISLERIYLSSPHSWP